MQVTQETQVQPGLGRCPGGGNGNLIRILTGITPWTEKPGKLQSMGSQELDMTERARARAHTHTHTHARTM